MKPRHGKDHLQVRGLEWLSPSTGFESRPVGPVPQAIAVGRPLVVDGAIIQRRPAEFIVPGGRGPRPVSVGRSGLKQLPLGLLEISLRSGAIRWTERRPRALPFAPHGFARSPPPPSRGVRTLPGLRSDNGRKGMRILVPASSAVRVRCASERASRRRGRFPSARRSRASPRPSPSPWATAHRKLQAANPSNQSSRPGAGPYAVGQARQGLGSPRTHLSSRSNFG